MPPLTEYWRCLEDLDPNAPPPPEDPGEVGDELAGSEGPVVVSRRGFVQLVGAGLATAGVAACDSRAPTQRIFPYSRRPADVSPGIPSHYATTHTRDGYGTGLVVTCWAGRPVKVEGNPLHPGSLGATGPIEQSLVWNLYDNDRARGLLVQGVPRPWTTVATELAQRAEALRARDGGAGLRFLVEPSASPLVNRLRQRVRERFPNARFITHNAYSWDAPREGARVALGQDLETIYDFTEADVVVVLDADPFGRMPGSLRYARQFVARHRASSPGANMNRLYVGESMWTVTGTQADHRQPMRSSQVGAVLRKLAAAVLGRAPGASVPAAARDALGRATVDASLQRWIDSAAADLAGANGRCVVVVGERQPAWVQALAHALNGALGAAGRTVRYVAPVVPDAGGPAGLQRLVGEMFAGQVQMLAVLGGNPAYTQPADVDFRAALGRVPDSLYLGLYANETATRCTTFVPALHELEAWGDARAFDGTVSLQQPLISPLFDGRTEAEVLSAFLGETTTDGHALVREHWRAARGAANFDVWWETVLRDGVIPETAASFVAATATWDGVAAAMAQADQAPAPAADALELDLLPSRKVGDGRYGNNPWLQELPDTVTKLTWGNAAMVGVQTARRLDVRTNNMVNVRVGNALLTMPVLVVPGLAEGTVAVELGYGRDGAETIARGVGHNAFRLRTQAAPWVNAAVAVQKADGEAHLPTTQQRWTTYDRPIVLEATQQEYAQDPQFTRPHKGRSLTLYAPVYEGVQWGMAVDLGACIGCNACVIACQAENNVPVVGATGVRRAREMHWLRIDTYFTGPPENPRVVQQPMMCQHCEKAPCEYVCPVNATVHSPDGLNEMAYNRCVGTRYCSNNCPYKVRRFNFFNYQAPAYETPSYRDLAFNPDVSVRTRGVMEKCTYCVQRIRRAEIEAAIQHRPMPDVVSACAQACPTGAIVFGQINKPDSGVSRMFAEPRVFDVLHHLGTEPRTKYLARIRNPNREMA